MDQMIPVNLAPFSSAPPWVPILPTLEPPSSSFWVNLNVHERLQELHNTLEFAKAMKSELEMLTKMNKEESAAVETSPNDTSIQEFFKLFEKNTMKLTTQESISLDAANSIMSKLRAQLEPFRIVTDESSRWEEKSMAVKLANKLQKYKRNKLGRKRKRKRIAEMHAKGHEQFEQADRDADEWRAREIARESAKQKVEEMKKVAKIKAKEERKRLESELELVLIVEKLQELRSIRIQKMKKQGYFMPEEDDKFLERVQAAVEEEERQKMELADTDTAKDAIATAEESRKFIQNQKLEPENPSSNNGDDKESLDHMTQAKIIRTVADQESGKQVSDEPGCGNTYDSLSSLPVEFYHYYHGSNTDMGTLIEVRRTWDAYIRAGGSRIPGHWVQPPPPADEIWASYLARPK